MLIALDIFNYYYYSLTTFSIIYPGLGGVGNRGVEAGIFYLELDLRPVAPEVSDWQATAAFVLRGSGGCGGGGSEPGPVATAAPA